jgi:hypothetical protein
LGPDRSRFLYKHDHRKNIGNSLYERSQDNIEMIGNMWSSHMYKGRVKQCPPGWACAPATTAAEQAPPLYEMLAACARHLDPESDKADMRFKFRARDPDEGSARRRPPVMDPEQEDSRRRPPPMSSDEQKFIRGLLTLREMTQAQLDRLLKIFRRVQDEYQEL